MPYQKGHKKMGGKQKGTPNRTTKQARELLEQILYGELENMQSALRSLKNESDSRYLDACSKLFTYVLPKKTDITTDGDKIKSELPQIIIKTKNV